MTTFEPIKDRNAGNGSNTYWKAFGEREWCIALSTGDFLRDAKGRVRRYGSLSAAVKSATKLGFTRKDKP